MKEITDTDRLKYLVENMDSLRLGYPSVFWIGEKHVPSWGFTSFSYNGKSLESFQSEIDRCIINYELEKQKFKRKFSE